MPQVRRKTGEMREKRQLTGRRCEVRERGRRAATSLNVMPVLGISCLARDLPKSRRPPPRPPPPPPPPGLFCAQQGQRTAGRAFIRAESRQNAAAAAAAGLCAESVSSRSRRLRARLPSAEEHVSDNHRDADADADGEEEAQRGAEQLQGEACARAVDSDNDIQENKGNRSRTAVVKTMAPAKAKGLGPEAVGRRAPPRTAAASALRRSCEHLNAVFAHEVDEGGIVAGARLGDEYERAQAARWVRVEL